MAFWGENPYHTETGFAGGTVVGQRFIKNGSAERMYVQCGDGEDGIGVVAYDAATGDAITMYPIDGGGVVLIEAGAAVSLFDKVAADSSGRAVTGATNDYQMGLAMQEAAQAGDKILVRIFRGGKIPA